MTWKELTHDPSLECFPLDRHVGNSFCITKPRNLNHFSAYPTAGVKLCLCVTGDRIRCHLEIPTSFNTVLLLGALLPTILQTVSASEATLFVATHNSSNISPTLRRYRIHTHTIHDRIRIPELQHYEPFFCVSIEKSRRPLVKDHLTNTQPPSPSKTFATYARAPRTKWISRLSSHT